MQVLVDIQDWIRSSITDELADFETTRSIWYVEQDGRLLRWQPS